MVALEFLRMHSARGGRSCAHTDCNAPRSTAQRLNIILLQLRYYSFNLSPDIRKRGKPGALNNINYGCSSAQTADSYRRMICRRFPGR